MACARCWCILLLLPVVFATSTSSFNFEVGQRAWDNVHGLLNSVKFASAQVSEAFQLGFKVPNQQHMSQLDEYFRSILQSMPEIDSLSLATSDVMLSSSQQGTSLFSHNCTEATSNSQFCMSVHNAFAPAIPSLNLTLSVVDMLGTNLTNSSMWTPIHHMQGNSSAVLEIAWAIPFSNPTTSSFGHVAVGLSLGTINQLFANSFESATVFVVTNEGILVASTTCAGGCDSGCVLGAPARNCTSSPVSQGALLLQQIGTPAEDTVYHEEDQNIQYVPYKVPGLSWYIVVVSTAEIMPAAFAAGSTEFYVVASLSIGSACISALLLLWVVVFRKLRLWKAAQPLAIGILLVSNCACSLCALLVLGEPSTAMCLLRQGLGIVVVTMVCASLLVKLLRVYIVLHGSSLTNQSSKVTNMKMGALVLTLTVVQVVIVGAWLLASPATVQTSYDTKLGVVVARKICHIANKKLGFVSGLYLGLLILCGLVLMFKTRNISTVFAESRTLPLTFVHGALLIVVTLSLAMFGGLSRAAVGAVVAFGVLWFTTTIQMTLFFPRVYRQVTLGDYTEAEMKERIVQHITAAKMRVSRDFDSVPQAIFVNSAAQNLVHRPQQQNLGDNTPNETNLELSFVI